MKVCAGFTVEMDHQLFQAMKLETCSAWQKLVVLLLDEMHIREDLVYDKHCGSVIGERAKRARHSQVCSIENRGYIYI